MRLIQASFIPLMLFLAFAPLSRAADPPSASGVDLKAMDPTANACQNFYQYACGAWRKENPIPPDRSRWGRFAELQERNLAIERQILERAEVPSATRTPAEQQIGDFYGSCMDEQAIEAKGIQPIAPLLESIQKMSSKQDLTREIARLHQESVGALFNFGVRPDAKNTKDQIAAVDQGGLGLPDRDYYLKDDERSSKLRLQYAEHVKIMLDLLRKAQGLGPDPDSAARVDAIMRIETRLADAAMDRTARRNPDNTYHKMTVAQLVALDTNFGWRDYLGAIGLPPIQTLNVAAPDFVKSLQPLIDMTSLDDWKSYLTWHVLRSAADNLTRALQDEDFRFNGQILRGAKEIEARWKRCVEATDRALGDALGQKFVEVAFGGPSKTKALELVGQIEKEMSKDIQSRAVDVARHQGPGAHQAARSEQQDRLPGQVERLQLGQDRARRLFRRRVARAPVRNTAQSTRSSANRWTNRNGA